MSDFLEQNWIHYSTNEIKELKNNKVSNNMKPVGLYFAPNKDWLRYCSKSNWFISLNKYEYKISDIKNLNILNITDEKILKKYLRKEELFFFIKVYNWEKMKTDGYDGIYISKESIDSDTWSIYDVETLCIWNTKKIKIELISINKYRNIIMLRDKIKNNNINNESVYDYI